MNNNNNDDNNNDDNNNDEKNPVATFMANVVIICLGLAVSAVALGFAAAILSWIF